MIAEYQCDVLYRGPKLALAEFLPLKNENWITCGNALRLDWLSLCPPTGTGVKLAADDLFETPLDQTEIDFANEGGETYICGNPPYLGSQMQSDEQKADLKGVFDTKNTRWKSLDYVAGWFMKAADYLRHSSDSAAAFVATNSICQGRQVSILWPLLFGAGCHIHFAHTSFKWANLASYNADVTVAIVGITRQPPAQRRLYSQGEDSQTAMRKVDNINAYLVPETNVIVEETKQPISDLSDMGFGSMPNDGGHLLLNSAEEVAALKLTDDQRQRFVKKILGSAEMIRGIERYCLWICDEDTMLAQAIPAIAQRL